MRVLPVLALAATAPTAGAFSFSSNPLASIFGDSSSSPSAAKRRDSRRTRAKDIVTDLVVEENCFASTDGAVAFGEACDVNVIYEDCYEPQPIVGKTAVTNHLLAKVASRQEKGGFRLDRVSDGDRACGFAWTWTTDTEEGLRGTTFVELNPENGKISFVREIPEPLYKPGDLTQKLLEAVTAGAEKKEVIFERRTPRDASDIARYLFDEVQGGDIEEGMRFFDEGIFYRDFNFEEPLRGKAEVKQFIEDFSFPGITFRLQKVDDGVMSTSFCWEVVLEGASDTIKGLSLYSLSEETGLIEYVRDVPESAIKPPILGKLARQVRPGLGTFTGVKLGSREGGK